MTGKLLIASLVVAVCLVSAGCAGSDRAGTAPVEGQVTYKGRPVAGATVSFLCSGAPRPAIGTTDASGNYRLTTFQPNDGAVVGTHVVTVNVYSTRPEATLPVVDPGDSEAVSKAIDEAVRQTQRQNERANRERPTIPPKYAHRNTSDLHKEVVRGKNVINIELSD